MSQLITMCFKSIFKRVNCWNIFFTHEKFRHQKKKKKKINKANIEIIIEIK